MIYDLLFTIVIDYLTYLGVLCALCGPYNLQFSIGDLRLFCFFYSAKSAVNSHVFALNWVRFSQDNQSKAMVVEN